MAKDEVSAAGLLIALLERLGIHTLFGVPGTQNIQIFDALSDSAVRPILASQETAASFMAVGFARASGKPGVLVTIPGPGLLFAIPGLMEARHDSVPLLCISIGGEHSGKHQFRLQQIDTYGILKPICKQVFTVLRAETLPQVLHEAYSLAQSGEPGPVYLEVSSNCLASKVRSSLASVNIPPSAIAHADAEVTNEVARRLSESKKPLLLVGLGCSDAPHTIDTLANVLDCPVVPTSSARGIISDSHHLCLVYDFGDGGGKVLNELIRESDCVLALGCKFSHNGTGGFQLEIPPEKLIHVDASREVLGANYSASILVEADVPAFLADVFETPVFQSLLQRISAENRAARVNSAEGWTVRLLSEYRRRLRDEQLSRLQFVPNLSDAPGKSVEHLFHILSEALPERSIIVTDSGQHQRLTRNFATIEHPRGLIIPSDFQSMGFGLPAAIGAKLGAPDREVVVITGDGGFAAVGMELLTAIREQISITVIVFNDGYLNAIRHLQLQHFGREESVALKNPDFEQFAASIGASYSRFTGSPLAFDSNDNHAAHLVEVRLSDPDSLKSAIRNRHLKEQVKSIVGDTVVRTVKGMLGR